MAVTYAATTVLPTQDVITLSATAGKVTQVTLNCTARVSFYARTSAAKLVFGDDVAQVDDTDLGAADYSTLPADQWVPLNMRRGSGPSTRVTFYLASTSASQVIEIMLEEDNHA